MSLCRVQIIGIVLIALTFLSSCKKEKVTLELYDDTPYVLNLKNTTLPQPTLPSDNPMTVEKFKLGRKLFFSKLLSLDGTVSCASCHLQQNAFSDPNQFSEGVGGAIGSRQAMAIVNMAWNTNGFFWDGRAELLRHQALLPIQDDKEMNETLNNVCLKLMEDELFKEQFIRAYGSWLVTPERIANALEVYMFGLVSDNSKYDRFLMGLESLTDSEERGRVLFFGEYNPFFPDVSGADCAHCHAGNNFENDQYINNGLDTDANFTDLGRELVTGNANDRARFKIPTLRNIEETAPYMHDGRFQTLEEVIEHYNNGVQNSSTVDPALLGTKQTGLMLDAQEIQDLVNFLKTLTDYTFLQNPEYSE